MTSAAPGPGTAIPAPAATSSRGLLVLLLPSSIRNGRGRSADAAQPEILSYLRHVADRFDLRRDIHFNTRVRQASWEEPVRRWRVTTSRGDVVRARFCVMAVGCLSEPKAPDLAGIERFCGELLYTARWPHEPPDLTGKRVGVVGTGSSGVQCIPIIAEQAAELTVFMRTPSFALPAHNVRSTRQKPVCSKPVSRAPPADRESRGGVLGTFPRRPPWRRRLPSEKPSTRSAGNRARSSVSPQRSTTS